MRALLSIFAFILLTLFISATPVRADYQTAYTDYVFAQSLYRTSYGEYQSAKSTFLTYRTLAAQNEAIAKLKKVLQDRNQVMFTYYDLMGEKLAITDGVTPEFKTSFNSIRLSEQKWLTEHQTKIEAAASLNDLNSVSGEFEGRYRQMQSETGQAFGAILIAKETLLKSRTDVLATNMTQTIATVSASGEDVSTYQRNLITARNKLTLYDQKMVQVKGALVKPIGQPVDLFRGQQLIAEANQYLRDTVNSMLEIVNLITR